MVRAPEGQWGVKRVLGSLMVSCLCAVLLGGLAVQAQSPEPATDRLAPPTMPANPTQADEGAQVYYLNCMSCHGDRGQGLTDEWRAVYPEEDQNCWQSKCHGPNHPPDGFELVRFVPPVFGEGLLARFQNAAGLQRFIGTRMPWQKPGSLTEDEYWQVTAFLARVNGLYSGSEPLGPQNAVGVSLAATGSQATEDLPPVLPPEMPPPRRSSAVGWLVAGTGALIVAALVTIGLVRRTRR